VASVQSGRTGVGAIMFIGFPVDRNQLIRGSAGYPALSPGRLGRRCRSARCRLH
jgi:hypothetical protein